ncbi:hypothetical protein BH24BAC1_BH24BAC1_20630 [soil metagenome]
MLPPRLLPRQPPLAPSLLPRQHPLLLKLLNLQKRQNLRKLPLSLLKLPKPLLEHLLRRKYLMLRKQLLPNSPLMKQMFWNQVK